MKKSVRNITPISAIIPASSIPLFPRRDSERRCSFVVIGDGKDEFTLPSVQEVVMNGKLYIEQKYIQELRQMQQQQLMAEFEQGGQVDVDQAGANVLQADDSAQPMISLDDVLEEEESEEDDTRFAADVEIDATGPSIVQATQEQLSEDRFCAAIEGRIQPLMSKFEEAGQDLNGKPKDLVRQLQPLQEKGIVANLQLNTNNLKELYEQALPELYEHACSKFKPLTGNDTNVEIAAEAIDNHPKVHELMQTLTIYSDAIEQILLDLHRRQRFIIEYLAVDMFRTMIKGGARLRFKQGDVCLCLVCSSDPATIPTLGSPGANVIFGSRNLEHMQMRKMCIFGHEIIHDAYDALENYVSGLTGEVLGGLDNAVKNNTLTFTADTISVLGSIVPTLDVMMQLFGQDVLNELNADVGAIRRFGKSFVLGMIEYFAALFNDQQNVTVFTKGNRSIPNATVYLVDKQTGALLFEAHLPPAVRIILNCYVLASMGLVEDAQYCLEVFKQITKRKRMPKWAVWFSEDGRNAFKIRSKDILSAGIVAIDRIQHAKLESFSGNSLAEVLPFTKVDQKLIDQIVDLIADESQSLVLPEGEFGATHIGAAAQLAGWVNVSRGLPTEEVNVVVEDRSYNLLQQVNDRAEAKRHGNGGVHKITNSTDIAGATTDSTNITGAADSADKPKAPRRLRPL